MSERVADIVAGILKGERRSVARAISLVEDEDSNAVEILKGIYSRTGKSHRIGITGPPGAGKSTITNKLARHYRGSKSRVGIIAVDPTSPFTGGALLGDRVRMSEVELDDAVFIRSMASRGSLGGLSRKAHEAADILDAAGYDRILMETVGVGQSELDIASVADTTVVVLVPESGDSIQAMKAGLMEIADFFVVNKADRAGAEQAVTSIKMILNFKSQKNGWTPDVLRTIAQEGKGIDSVASMINAHRKYLESSTQLHRKRAQRTSDRIRELVAERLHVDFWTKEREEQLSAQMESILNFTQNPYDLAEKLLQDHHRADNKKKRELR